MATDPFSLAGKVALVTGASGGLGAHFARVLADAGATVALAARRKEKIAEAAGEIRAAGLSAMAVSLDVTDSQNIAAALDTVSDELGPVSVLINNAGIATSAGALDVTDEDWDRVLETNLKGAWAVAQACAARMAEAETGGVIVNIASIMGLRVTTGVAPYAVSKAGVVQMTKVLALELARHDIRVNALAPGYIETDINRNFLASDPGRKLIKRIPQRRVGQPDDLDGALLLLASDASSYMTGSVLAIDGGHLVSPL